MGTTLLLLRRLYPVGKQQNQSFQLSFHSTHFQEHEDDRRGKNTRVAASGFAAAVHPSTVAWAGYEDMNHAERWSQDPYGRDGERVAKSAAESVYKGLGKEERCCKSCGISGNFGTVRVRISER